MDAIVMVRSSIVVACICFLTGILGSEALAQVRNDRLYNDIVSGGVNELSLSLAAGIDPNAEVFMPGREIAISLMELSIGAQNDDAAAQLLQVGAGVDPLVGGRFAYTSPLALFAQQEMSRTLTAYIDRDNTVLVEHGGAAFLEAVWAGNMSTARVLLDRTAALVGQDQLQAPLDEALAVVAGRNDVAATQKLVELGADPSSGLPLISAVARCSPDTAEELVGYSAGALPYYQGEHVASYAQRCLSEGFVESEEEAVERFSQIVQLLYEVDSTVCSEFVDVSGGGSSTVDSVLENLDLCQEIEGID